MKLNINDEQGIEFLHWIFERELKLPFRNGKVGSNVEGPYQNRDGECIGWLDSLHKKFELLNPFWGNIKYKTCAAYELNTLDWWKTIRPHLKSWLENQINVKLDDIYL